MPAFEVPFMIKHRKPTYFKHRKEAAILATNNEIKI